MIQLLEGVHRPYFEKPSACVCICVSVTYIDTDICVWTSQVALVVKNPPVNAGDVRDWRSIPGQDSLEEGGAWRAVVHRVTKSQTQLKRLSPRHTSTYIYIYIHIYIYMYIYIYVYVYIHTHNIQQFSRLAFSGFKHLNLYHIHLHLPVTDYIFPRSHNNATYFSRTLPFS